MKRIAVPVLAGLLLFGGGVAVAAPKPSPTPTTTPPPPVLGVPRVVQASAQAGTNPELAADVYCDWQNGEHALGGGGAVPRDQDPAVKWVLVDSRPIKDSEPGPIGWHAQALRTGGDTTTVGSMTAYAICAKAQ